MRYAHLTGPRSIAIEEAETPRPSAGQVVVEIDACGVGGADRHAWERGSSPAPAWFGHEWTGRIVDVGSDVRGRFPGQRVVAGVSSACGHCALCIAGRTDNCRTVLEQIVGLDPLAADHGGFSTHTVADARRVVPVHDAISTSDAAMIEPASVAAHALRRSALRLGDTVAVIGTGTVGLLASELCRIAGASHVVSVDTAPARRELACDLGADAAFESANESLFRWVEENTGGLGFDVVFVCVDTTEALASGLRLVCPGGTIVAVGVGDRIDNLSVTSLLKRESDFRVSLGYSAADSARVQALIAQDRLRLRPLQQAGPERTLDDLAEVFAAGTLPALGPPKVLIRP